MPDDDRSLFLDALVTVKGLGDRSEHIVNSPYFINSEVTWENLHSVMVDNLVLEGGKRRSFADNKNTYGVAVALRRLDDDLFRQFFPLSKAQASIVKLRLTDWLRSVSARSQYLPMLEGLAQGGFDYLTTVNILSLTILKPIFYTSLARAGYFEDFDRFKLSAKKLSNHFKRCKMKQDIRGTFSELHNVLSFQVEAVPGELKILTQQFAESGVKRREWFPTPDECMIFPEHKFVDPSLADDYISKALWVTSGSASFGKYDLNIDGNLSSRKFNKAQIPLFMEQKDINLLPQNIVLNTFIKPEPAKRRMATAGDLPSYLITSAIFEANNVNPSLFPGSTLEATSKEEGLINDRMIKLCENGYWGCPYDFAQFDHQPSSIDLKTLHKLYANPNDPYAWPLFDGMDHTYLFDAQDRIKFKVTGGLMSGLRTTSFDGNAFAYYVKKAIIYISNQLGIDIAPLEVIYRGDDSSDFFKSPAQALIYTMLVHYSGLELGIGKFGIGQGNTEFLRNWYDAEGMVGYACRSIVAVNARKPWTNDEPDVALKKRNILEGIETTKRRLKITRTNISLTALLRIDDEFLHAPLTRGGIGYGIPKTSKYDVISNFKSIGAKLNYSWWQSNQQWYLNKYGLTGDINWPRWANDHFVSTIAESRPLGIPRLYARTSVKGRSFNPITQKVERYPMLTAPFNLFGQGKRYEDRLAFVNLFKKYSDPNLKIKDHMPTQFNRDINQIIKVFGVSKNLAIEYYFGKLPLQLSNVPARLISALSERIAAALFPQTKFADDYQFIFNVWFTSLSVSNDLMKNYAKQFSW